jgi:hypothetical protein
MIEICAMPHNVSNSSNVRPPSVSADVKKRTAISPSTHIGHRVDPGPEAIVFNLANQPVRPDSVFPEFAEPWALQRLPDGSRVVQFLRRVRQEI